MASIAAVRDILSDIESKGGNNNKLANSEEKENKSGNSNSSCNCEGPPAVGGQRGPQTGFYHRGDISGTSSSLVVDVHLPPEERQQQQQHQQQQKLCKHSVSRFQRCYSDGSQAQSPSAKRKVSLSFLNLLICIFFKGEGTGPFLRQAQFPVPS